MSSCCDQKKGGGCCGDHHHGGGVSENKIGVSASSLLADEFVVDCGGGDHTPPPPPPPPHDHTHDNAHSGGSTKTSSCCESSHKVTTTMTPPDEISTSSSPPLCLAVIRESGTDIVIFDASGRPKSFRYSGDVRNLCFSSHGSSTDDLLLTPCFNEEGLHGDPEESCFCGLDTPHLHAHVKNPATCGSVASSSKGEQRDLSFLANQVLLPVATTSASITTATAEDDTTTLEGMSDDDEDAAKRALLNIRVSDSMPKQCNSRTVKQHMDQQGVGMTGINRHHRRVHKVQHDDHMDYLVHDAKSGQLHLSYPCDECGMDDVHGTFTNVGSRRLVRSGSSDVQLHFFEVDQHRPFSILEHLQNLFQTHHPSDRVAAATNLMVDPAALSAARRPSSAPPASQQPVRSNFACSGICCSSETPVILKILEPVKGIHKVMVNVAVKQVMVDHDPNVISTFEVAGLLTRNGFEATITFDGSAAAMAAAALSTESGRTVMYVEGICCASEVPTIKSILEPLPGVERVSVNDTTKLVYVNHNLALVKSQQLSDALLNEGFPSEIREDAAKNVMSAQSAYVRSLLALESTSPDTDALTAFLRTYDSAQLESFVVDIPAKAITVVHNPFVLSAQAISEALVTATGIVSSVTTDGADPKTWSVPEWEDIGENLEVDEGRTYPRLNVILSGICWVISMLHYIGGNWEYLTYVALLSIALGIPPIAMKAYRTLRRYQFDTNSLMFFASIGAVALQEYPEAAALVFLFSLSEWLEVRATSRARRALAAIVQLRPDKANIVHPSTKELIVVPASCVPVGALVSVKPGDKVPCDGVVVDGVSTMDESSLTGESRPVRKGAGDDVSGGTVNSGLTPLTIRTTCTADNSAVARLIRLVEEAQVNKSETEKLVDEFAKYYTPVVVLAAIFMISIPWAFGTEVGRLWTNNGLVLIVIACPCALIISTPVSYVAGLAATAQKGVLIKGGAHLEALGLVKRICFDKTGTLTNGEFALLHLQVTSDQLTRKDVLEYLCLMEERASHPVAFAILKAAANERVTVPRDKVLQKHSIVEGEGIIGVVDDVEIHVGNERMFIRLGLYESLSDTDRALVDSWKAFGGTVGFMAIQGMGIVCAFCAADKVRPESVGVVQKLKKMGIKTVMLTGDNRSAALAIGRQVGLDEDDVLSGLLPEDKLREVTKYSGLATRVSVVRNPCGTRQLTMMVGDGVNDGPALAIADVGVAMGQGAALAMETADVTLLDSNLEKLEYAMNMGRRVLAKIKQNIVFSLAVKFTVLGFALAGKTNLWAAIATDVGSMILVTLNSMMLLPARQRGKDVQALRSDLEKGIVSHPTPHTESGHNKSTSCKKGCCGSSSAPAPPPHSGSNENASASSCKKGCCSSSSASVAAPSPPGGSKENASASSCKKGCCGSSSSSAPVASPTKHVHENAKKPQSAGHGKACCIGPAMVSNSDPHPAAHASIANHWLMN